jgi:A/G-specific adenine glycosylase
MKKSFQHSWPIFLDQLRSWYHPDNRKLPWKNIRDPYLVWVSEIFLQQTQADRVVEYFLRFTAKFPTVEKLAKASFEQALPYFKGLGYYSRLRRMLVTAEVVVREFDGQFPSEVEILKKLPGIGEYTARAIASFAFGKKVIAPDTNVKRILERFFGNVGNVEKIGKSGMKVLSNFDQLYPQDFSLNQALMDLGSQVCLARSPKCGECPLVKKCCYVRNPKSKTPNPKQIPSPKSEIPNKIPRDYQKVVVGILIQDKRVLVSRRKSDQTYAGLLEFPGGKVEVGEDERSAMQREFREEVGVEVSVRPAFEKIVKHDKKQVLHFHRCRVLVDSSGIATPSMVNGQSSMVGQEGQEVQWIEQGNLNSKEFLPANKGIIDQLKKSRL